MSAEAITVLGIVGAYIIGVSFVLWYKFGKRKGKK